MANNLPITIVMSSLPPQVKWSPQNLADAIAQRLSLQTQVNFALVVAGVTAPLSNVGPWFNESTGTWWAWNNGTGSYQPMPNNPTTLYAARATPSVTQTVSVDTAKHKVNFSTEVFDPEGVFSGSAYTAPVDGYYAVGCNLRVNNGTAVAASMVLTLEIWKNGSGLLASTSANVPSPAGSAWFPNTGYQLIQLNAGDYIEAYLTGEDGTNTGNVVVQVNSIFCANLVQEIQ